MTQTLTGDVKSPCTAICQVNTEQVCIGCYRTLDEIQRWSTCSSQDKHNIIAAANLRKKSTTEQP